MLSYTNVTLSENAPRVAPGESVETVITVKNDSNIVDVYSVEVAGLPNGWHRLSVSTISLFPGDQGSCTLTMAPPMDSSAAAQSYPFSVNVVSRKDPTQAAKVDGMLDVLAFESFDVALSPESIKGPRGRFSLDISNHGNSALKFDVDASDQKKQFMYSLDPAHPRVEAGQRATVNLLVESRSRPLRKPLPPAQFQVSVAPERDGAAPKILAGMLEITPRLPKWALPVGIGVLAILILAVAAVVFFFNTRQSWDIDTPVGFMDRRFSETIPTYHPIAFDLPDPAPAVLHVNAEWQIGGPASMRLVVRNADGRCQRAEEHSDSQAVDFSITPDPANWQDPCQHLAYLDGLETLDGWVVVIENATEFQAIEVNVQIGFGEPAP